MSWSDDASTEAICPCSTFIHPRVIVNAPGRSSIAYRVGDYTTFRYALLLARAGETELSQPDATQTLRIWRPSATGDLALQLMEWWAYLADVLTFYNERVASQAYLRTADQPEAVNRLIRLLGYRPRPGIGAVGTLAALVNGSKQLILPKGFQVQSKPGPGKQPQVFELAADVKIDLAVTAPSALPQGTIEADPPPDPALLKINAQDVSVFIQGSSSAVKKGDEVLILTKDPLPPGQAFDFHTATVEGVTHRKGTRKQPITQIQFTALGDLSAIVDVRNYRLLTSNQTSQVWQYPADPGVVVRTVTQDATTATRVDLEAIARAIKVGDYIVFEDPELKPSARVGRVGSSTEVVWFANPKDPTNPGVPPDPKMPPIPIPHTSFAFTPALGPDVHDTQDNRPRFLVRYAWQEVGSLISASITSTGGGGPGGGPAATVTLQPVQGASFPDVPVDTPVLVEDAIGNGALGILHPPSTLELSDGVPALNLPVRVLFNLLPVTRGKTVANEVLGNGNAALAGQDFVLKNTPVTYLQSPASTSGDNYSSTVQVFVNGVQWSEVPSFFGQHSDAQVFITREDDQGKTHVVFGDGESGGRLPTGTNNVIATYRYGSGAEAPDAGSLTVILQPQPGLTTIRNPVAVGGGSDPDPPKKVRQLAPRSVLAFNRAVSANDYEAIAAQAPGVVRARAVYAFDAVEQRPQVKIWVGDDQGAVNAARTAITDAADPNRLPSIELARQIELSLSATLVLDSRRDPKAVLNAVHDALLDPDTGLLGANVVPIGQVIFDSQVFAACLGVAGVRAVRDYRFSIGGTDVSSGAVTNTPDVTDAAQIHNPGDNGYFFLPDDGRHLMLSTQLAQ